MTPEELDRIRGNGFVVSTNEDPDLFDFFKQKFLAANPDLSKSSAANKKVLKALEDFVVFCKARILANPPVTFTYMDRGMAIQFADYTRTLLVNNNENLQKAVVGIDINTAARGQAGPNVFQQVDLSVPITR
jgi:hypothetical protein